MIGGALEGEFVTLAGLAWEALHAMEIEHGPVLHHDALFLVVSLEDRLDLVDVDDECAAVGINGFGRGHGGDFHDPGLETDARRRWWKARDVMLDGLRVPADVLSRECMIEQGDLKHASIPAATEPDDVVRRRRDEGC